MADSVPAPLALITSRDRDATPTIRGFVYQVDVTLLRWLSLEPGEHLELECGEDIDHVRSLIADPDSQRHHLLEAVKHREANLTLRSEEALEALAGFHEHRENNPQQRLSFRYITTSDIGRERPTLTTDGTPGIEIWQRARSNTGGPSQALSDGTALRDYLKATPRPCRLSGQTWNAFHAFLGTASPEQFLGFVRAFEWSVRNPSAVDMRDEVLEKLAAKLARSRLAQRFYEHLFVSVFKLLSSDGRKVLNSETLEHAFGHVGSDPDVPHIMARLTSLETQLQRLTDAEPLLNELLLKSDRILAAVEKRSSVETAAQPAYSAQAALMLDVPPPDRLVSPRKLTVDRLTVTLGACTWLALYGGIGTGKTQLAIQIAQRFHGRTIWVRLRGVEGASINQTLDLALASVGGSSGNVPELYARTCEGLGAGGLIVLDDLPAISGRNSLVERLALLSSLCTMHGVKLLTTAGDRLPPVIEERIDQQLQQLSAPTLSESEIHDVLVLLGCPSEALTSSRARAVGMFSHGHPVLVRAVSRVLEIHEWRFDESALSDIMASKFGSDIAESVLRWLMETVPDEPARTLLYRLRLVSVPFCDAQVCLVAQVPPEIPLPIERLSRLAGLWVQRDSEELYAISPLVPSLPTSNLTEKTTRDVHLALAKYAVKNRTLGPFDVLQAVLHFSAAQQFSAAAFFLLFALQRLALSPGKIPEDFGLTMIWAFQDFPQGIALGARIQIRGMQAVIQTRRGEDATYTLANLERLINEAGAEQSGPVLGTSGVVALWVGQTNPLFAGRLLLQGLSALRHHGVPGELLDNIDPKGTLLRTFGLLPLWIHSFEQAANFLDLVKHLDAGDRSLLFPTKETERVLEMMVTNIWLRETKRSATDQNWPRVLEQFAELGARSRSVGLMRLYLEANRAVVFIKAEYLGDLAGAIAAAESVLADAARNPQAQFLMCEMAAQRLYLAGRREESLTWWRRALGAPRFADDEMWVSALTFAGATAALLGDSSGRVYLQEAASLAPSLGPIHWLTALRALGEYAIVLWEAGGRRAAYAPWARAAHLIGSSRDDSPDWKIAFRVFGNCASYFAHELNRKTLPWNYAVPRPGILLQRPEAVLSSYKPAYEWLQAMNLGEFAWFAGEHADAESWAFEAIQKGRATSAQDVLYVGALPRLWVFRAPQLLACQACPELIDGAVSLTRPPIETISDDILTDEEHAKARVALPEMSRLAAELIVFACAVHITRLSVDNPTEAVAAGAVLGQRCQAAIVDSCQPLLWNTAAELFRQCCSEKPWRTVYEVGLALGHAGQFLLGAVYCLRAALVAPALDALKLQLAVLNPLDRYFAQYPPPYSDLYSLLLPPLVMNVWRVILDKRPFELGLLPYVRRQFSSLEKLPPDNAVMKEVLQLIALSLNLRLGDEQRAWLDGERNQTVVRAERVPSAEDQ